MTHITHSQILQDAFDNKTSLNIVLEVELEDYINNIAKNIYNQKGVFTVLVTLLVHKIYAPEQDIRFHQSNMPHGFSGRSIDTKYITPLLKKLGFPAMAESGWLTRSLEQPYPYNLEYNGKISGKDVKESFLKILYFIEEKKYDSKNILIFLLYKAWDICKNNQIAIHKITQKEILTIQKIYDFLSQQFLYPYKVSGGSKLPVIALHTVMRFLIPQISRYSGCHLKELGSHTASDKTSKTSGDIEIMKDNILFETFEIKLDKKIDAHLLHVVQDKIYKYNPHRYYILSCVGLQKGDEDDIKNIIQEIHHNHGCQIIVNGVLETIKYYLRLIDNIEDFFQEYLMAIENDIELKVEHKLKTNALIENFIK